MLPVRGRIGKGWYLLRGGFCAQQPRIGRHIYAEAPRILFPFARRVMADATRDAGFAPLLLDPIDFQGLYLQNIQRQQDGQPEAPNA